MNVTPQHIYILIRAILSLVISVFIYRYLTSDVILRNFGVLWLITYPVIIIFLICNLIMAFKSLPKMINIYNFALLLIVFIFPFLPTLENENLVFEAHLNQERSSWNIKLFSDDTFIITRSTLGGYKEFNGLYKLNSDTIELDSYPCTGCGLHTDLRVSDGLLIPIDSDEKNCFQCLEIETNRITNVP